jgi:hypothetical protein
MAPSSSSGREATRSANARRACEMGSVSAIGGKGTPAASEGSAAGTGDSPPLPRGRRLRTMLGNDPVRVSAPMEEL